MKHIRAQEDFAEACRAIQMSPWASVDTEADSLHHYVEKLCLLQISTASDDYVIDPLVPLEVAPVVRLLERKPLVLHGADFDIRILKRFYGFSPADVFDTMIAAQLLGYERQGFADLAEKHCGVKLSKKAQRADWSERPLSEELLTYAANDTHYLKPIADRMREELIAVGRLEWHRQFCARMIQSATAEREAKNTEGLAWQLKGSKELDPAALTALKELWHWREEEARRRDRPSFKIIHSEVLLQVAAWSSEHPSTDVAEMPHAPRNVKNEYRDILNQLLRKAKTLPPTSYVSKKPKDGRKKWTHRAETFLKALKEEREREAKELKIQPSLLATNFVLEELSIDSSRIREELVKPILFMPWQVQVLGESFLKILSGNR